MKSLLLALLFGAMALHSQLLDPLEGVWQGYDGEWLHVSRQLGGSHAGVRVATRISPSRVPPPASPLLSCRAALQIRIRY